MFHVISPFTRCLPHAVTVALHFGSPAGWLVSLRCYHLVHRHSTLRYCHSQHLQVVRLYSLRCCPRSVPHPTALGNTAPYHSSQTLPDTCRHSSPKSNTYPHGFASVFSTPHTGSHSTRYPARHPSCISGCAPKPPPWRQRTLPRTPGPSSNPSPVASPAASPVASRLLSPHG
jgi:hypothetical protein